MDRYIHNLSGLEKIYQGVPIADNAYYLIPENLLLEYKMNDDLMTDLTSQDVKMSRDGSNDIADIAEGINFLIGSETVLQEKKSPATNRLEVQILKPEGSSATKVSYDWTDKTTWYQNSIVVTGETMTDSGDGLTFNSLNDSWIDLTHGNLYDEYNLSDKKEPKIYDNAVEITTGFSIDYSSGNVTFDSAPSGSVTCDYWYANSSLWTLIPDSGKVLFIEHAELNFSKDIMVQNYINFEIWVYNPYDLPNKILHQKFQYKNIKDLINAANLGQGFIPAVAGLSQDVIIFPFNYGTVKPLQSSLGAELRISMENDESMIGEWATATFYVISEDE